MLLRLTPLRAVIAAGTAALIVLYFLRLFSESRQTSSSSSSARGLIEDINNSTLGFEKIFAVGLPTRTDRRDGMYLGAALSNIAIEFIDGVFGKDVPNKAIPSSPKHERLGDASIGSWRAHMNAVQEVVKRNLSSALILEDDVDWDIRLRSQLHDFALSAHALTQPLTANPNAYADITYPNPSSNSPTVVPDIDFNRLPSTVPPTFSPYGDDWDLLWIGHCGMHFPFEDDEKIPKGRVIHKDDETVARKKHLWTINVPFTLKDKYPDHTRAAHHVQEGVCTLGYAVSQKGARKILQEIALQDVSTAYDLLLRYFCEGSEGRRYHNCLTVQPSLFHHHRIVGPDSASSDIEGHGKGWREKPTTDIVRWGVRMNADALLEGRTDYYDEYPDDGKERVRLP